MRPSHTATMFLCATLSACAFTPRAAPGSAAADALIQRASFSSQTVLYRCAGGAELEVVYLNLEPGGAFAALHHGGRTALLQQRPSASGARYIALDEQHSLRWHTKGNEGQLSFLAADHTAHEQPLLTACRAVAPR